MVKITNSLKKRVIIQVQLQRAGEGGSLVQRDNEAHFGDACLKSVGQAGMKIPLSMQAGSLKGNNWSGTAGFNSRLFL